MEYYDTIFTLESVKNEWADRKQIAIQQVTLRLLQQPVVSKVIAWLKVAAVRESFVLAFPKNEGELQKYFTDRTQEYFSIYYNDQPVGSSAARTLTCNASENQGYRGRFLASIRNRLGTAAVKGQALDLCQELFPANGVRSDEEDDVFQNLRKLLE